MQIGIVVPDAKDVAAAREFYEKMGFSMNEQYSSNQAAFVEVDKKGFLV